MEHTKEPWEVREVDGLVAIANSDGFILEHDDDRQNIIDARRIVACVNACRDIPSEKLDGLATMARLGIELTDAINDPDGRFNRLEKEHHANEFALDKAGISGENCGAKVSKGIELLTAQRDELLVAMHEITVSEYEAMPEIALNAIEKIEGEK